MLNNTWEVLPLEDKTPHSLRLIQNVSLNADGSYVIPITLLRFINFANDAMITLPLDE